MDLNKIHKVYLIGIGGIGMSAIALYFKHKGKTVAGYDKTASHVTDNLQKTGIFIHFNESLSGLPDNFKINKEDTLVIYTPAIPDNHKGFSVLKQKNFRLYKRAEILGIICNNYNTIAVAGTHGKTSISTLTAHLFNNSNISRLAFLGGIANNYSSNLVLPESSNADVAVVEADEFDRSFLNLKPNMALISSIDADHLDIYSNKHNLNLAFNKFVNQINKNGILIYKKGLKINAENMPHKAYTYSLNDKADFYAKDLRLNDKNQYNFTLVTPDKQIEGLTLGIPGKINAENAVGALALAYLQGVNEEAIRSNLLSFSGVRRRFDYKINNNNKVYIDDYAHHPTEIKAFLTSVKEIYKDKKITGIFQPHLYSRTKDFAAEFAEALSMLDKLILLDIYPAREEPIEGISSKLIFDKLNLTDKQICSLDKLTTVIKDLDFEVLVTMGAGNIDTKVEEIRTMFEG